MLFYTRAREAVLLFFYFVSEGRRGRREISVVVSLRDENTEAAAARKQRERERRRESTGERAAQNREEREREKQKKYELLKNERTPLSLCLFPETFPGTRARRRERANEKKSRRRRRERARRGGGSANEDRAVFFRALQSVLCFVSLCWCQQRPFLPKRKGSRHKKKLREKLIASTKKKENFCDRRSLQNQTAPRRERRKRRKKEVLFSAFSASLSLPFPSKPLRAHLLNPHL